MQAKVFELRDDMTFIPIIAFRLEPANLEEGYLLHRAGYGRDPRQYIIMMKINGGGKLDCATNPFDMGQYVDMWYPVHQYLQEHFDELEPGAVIDAEYLRGESEAPKRSEREGY